MKIELDRQEIEKVLREYLEDQWRCDWDVRLDVYNTSKSGGLCQDVRAVAVKKT